MQQSLALAPRIEMSSPIHLSLTLFFYLIKFLCRSQLHIHTLVPNLFCSVVLLVPLLFILYLPPSFDLLKKLKETTGIIIHVQLISIIGSTQ